MRTVALVVLLAACSGDKREQPKADLDADRLKLANLSVRAFAFEAYPMWSAAHADKSCPDKLEELVTYLDKRKELEDPWGHRYNMFCGKNLPTGARGLAVTSNGPDGQPNTADDVRSWD